MTLSEWQDEILDMVRRRFWLILRVAVLGCFLSFFFALSQKHAYTSTAVLQVQGAMVADALAPPTVTDADARQLQIVEQQIMAHGAILQLGEQLGLLNDLAGLPESERVLALREAISISGVAAARSSTADDGAISLVRISATWGDRESAQALARAITERTIALSREKRLERARETLSFFSLRENRLEQQVAELDATIANFRDENDMPESGIRPSQEREIEALKAEILSVERQMIVLQRQLERAANATDLTLLERQERAQNAQRLSDLEEQHAYLSDSLAAVSEASEPDPALQVQLAQYQRRLATLQEELQSVSDNRKSAEVGYHLESRGQSEHLSVLEPASWPDYPSTPSRTKLAVLGVAASILAAFGLGFLLDMRKPVLRSAAVMERDLGYAPIVTVPQAKAERRRNPLANVFRRRKWMF